jgi:hypothetical protein
MENRLERAQTDSRVSVIKEHLPFLEEQQRHLKDELITCALLNMRAKGFIYRISLLLLMMRIVGNH